jgi:TolB-like protein
VVRSSIPDEVEDAVMQALEKTPADRFQTMKEFGERLSEAEAEAAMARTAARRASTAARRTTGARTGATARRKTAEVEATGGRRGAKFWSLAAGGLVLLSAIGFGVWKFTQRGSAAGAGGDAGPGPDHIAVMYFENRGGSDSLAYLADGITEALIHELSDVKPLQVVSRNGVAPFKKLSVTSDSIGRALKVGTLVEGTVAQSGNLLRVSVSLINAASGNEIGSKVLERPREEIFALQDDLAKEVAFFLRERLGSEVQLQQGRASTRNVAAWELVQKAAAETQDGDALVSANDSAGATRKYARTDSLLAQAERLDPKWPLPITQRGWLTYKLSRLAPSAPPSYHGDLIDKGLGHAARALALKADDPDALELRGTLRYWKWLNNLVANASEASQLYAGAEQDLRASVEANPNQASAWTTLSHLLINKPAAAEAKLAARRGYDADPYLTNANVTIWRLFTTSYVLEDAAEAKRWCDEGQRRFPKDFRFSECQLWYYSLKGAKPDVDSAWKALDQYVALSPPPLRELNRLKGQMRMAVALARAGLADRARSVAERSRGDATVDSGRELAELEALARSVLGDKDEAFRQLANFIASNPEQRKSLGSDDSWEWRDLRTDPRFASLVGGNQ